MIDIILSKLNKVRKTGRNQWAACCPAHEENNPSFGIKLLDDGRILMNCLAGCDKLSVLNAMGLQMSDLFPDKGLGEFQSFQKMQDDLQAAREKKQQDEIQHEKLILAACRYDRNHGVKKSTKEKEREAQAYLKVRRMNGGV